MFIIKNDWSISNLQPEGATVMTYGRNDPKILMTQNPYRHSVYLESGTYDMLVVNEVMFSEQEPNIAGVIYRGSDNFSTFGAYAKQGSVNAIFRSSSDNLMVGYNYPDHVATDNIAPREVLEEAEYVLKYKDGKNGFPTAKDFDADSVEVTPVRVTREVKVIAHVKNFKKGFRISGALRGFAEGVILSTRMPDGVDATYTFDLNSAVVDPDNSECHIIVTPIFNTFGPWWNDYPSDRRYTLDLFAAYSGEIFPFSFDVTENTLTSNTHTTGVIHSVGEAIRVIQLEEYDYESIGKYPNMKPIIIEVSLELPDIVGDDGGLDVGVGDWGQDIIIDIPMQI